MLILLFELSSKIVVPSSSLGHMLLVEIIIWVILPSLCTSAVHRDSARDRPSWNKTHAFWSYWSLKFEDFSFLPIEGRLLLGQQLPSSLKAANLGDGPNPIRLLANVMFLRVPRETCSFLRLFLHCIQSVHGEERMLALYSRVGLYWQYSGQVKKSLWL